MAKETFLITVRAGRVNGEMTYKREEVEGTKLKSEYGVDLFVHKDKGSYVISEVTTGSRITKSHKTKRDAVAELNEILGKMDADETKKKLQEIAEQIKTVII